MRMPRQRAQHLPRVGGIGRLPENHAVENHFGISGEHRALLQQPLLHPLPPRGDLGPRHPFDIVKRRFGIACALYDVAFPPGRFAQLQYIEVDAELAQQHLAPRALRCEKDMGSRHRVFPRRTEVSPDDTGDRR